MSSLTIDHATVVDQSSAAELARFGFLVFVIVIATLAMLTMRDLLTLVRRVIGCVAR